MWRVCPKCGHENHRLAMRCSECFENISNVQARGPVDDQDEHTEEEPIVADVCTLTLLASPTTSFQVRSGQTVGRFDEEDGSLADCALAGLPDDQLQYISRLHAKFTLQGGKWFVKNLSETNYTTVNGVNHGPEDPSGLPSDPVAINDEDILALTFAQFVFHEGSL